MTARTNILAEFPPLLKQFQKYSNAVHASGLDKRLIKLVEIRASQINGCANCLNMHSFEAHQLGETQSTDQATPPPASSNLGSIPSALKLASHRSAVGVSNRISCRPSAANQPGRVISSSSWPSPQPA